jgi:hypothetical protein
MSLEDVEDNTVDIQIVNTHFRNIEVHFQKINFPLRFVDTEAKQIIMWWKTKIPEEKRFSSGIERLGSLGSGVIMACPKGQLQPQLPRRWREAIVAE